MILNIFSVYDSKTKAYMQPYFSPTHGSALRAFTDEIANEQSLLAKHPEDFTLYHVGVWDDQTAQINPQDPATLGTAKQYQEIK